MLTAQQINQIQELQSTGINSKTLVKGQLDLIFKNNWFNIWVPKSFNGLELSFTDGLRLLEELAYWDAGFAWTITLCAGANMFVGFINPDLAKELWEDPKVCFGGSGKIGGKAIMDGDDYIISGSWNYATGAPHLTHFTLNAEIIIEDNSWESKSVDPIHYSFFVPKEQVLIHYDWDSFGLECTASHSFSLNNVRVSKEHAFILDPEFKTNLSPLFRIPFLPFAQLTLFMNYAGMFRRFLDLMEKYYFEKSKDPVWSKEFSKIRFKELDEVQILIEKEVIQIIELSKTLWEMAVNSLVIDKMLSHEIENATKKAVKIIREKTVHLFPYAGIRAAQKENELNIVFRNLFTATQHSLLNI